MLCETKSKEGKTNTQDCHRRNVTYQTWCRTCTRRQDEAIETKYKEEGEKKVAERKKNAKRFIYIGETNRSVFERGLEHTRDIEGCKTSSHMLRHLIGEHESEEENWDKIEFGMKILKGARSAFERQVSESVIIQQERSKHHLMNSKSEFNRCALPRLTAKLGEVELGKWREKDREEMIQEASIEEKIRSRKKKKSLERAERARRMEQDQPKKKRRKVDKGDKDSMARVQGLDEVYEEDKEVREIKTSTPRKRHEVNEKSPGKPRKRRKIHTSIRDYITCKR